MAKLKNIKYLKYLNDVAVRVSDFPLGLIFPNSVSLSKTLNPKSYSYLLLSGCE